MIAARIFGAKQRAAAGAVRARNNIMPGRENIGAKRLRRIEEIGELDIAVAGDAGNRRLALDIALGEAVDDLFAEPLLVIEHVMRNIQPGRDLARVMNILTGAAGALAMLGGAVIVKLQRHADHVVALLLEQRCDDRGINAARHRDNHPRLGGRLRQIEAVERFGTHAAIGSVW